MPPLSATDASDIISQNIRATKIRVYLGEVDSKSNLNLEMFWARLEYPLVGLGVGGDNLELFGDFKSELPPPNWNYSWKT